MKTKSVIEIAAAAIVSIIVLVFAFQYQQNPPIHSVAPKTVASNSTSVNPAPDQTLQVNSTLTKNQTAPVPVSHVIPRVGQFVTSDYASKQIPDSMFKENRTVILHDFAPSFMYLKYNGSVTLRNSLNNSAQYPSFLGYPADPRSDLINYTTGGGEPIIFNHDNQHGKMFVNSTEDRFVWVFLTDNSWRDWTACYVDARSGQFFGYYNACADYKPLIGGFPCPV